MTSIKHISFSPSQLPDIPISSSSRPRTESAPATTHSQHSSEAYNRFSGIFSSADVDFLVNLTLRAEWKDVEFYIQFLISHYEQFLNNNNHISEIIVAKLYELLVRVKSQKFYEAIEYYDRDTAIAVLTAEIAPIAKYLSPFHLLYLQKMYNDRSVFLEYKMNIAREYGMGLTTEDSCVKYRNIIATELREQLNELLNMYGASFGDSHSKRGRSSETNTTPYILSSEQSPRGWKRKLSDATHTHSHTFSSQPSNLQEDSQQLKKKRTASPETSTQPTQKLGNMDVLLEAFDIVDHDNEPKPAFQTFHEVTPAKVKHKQPKLDASIEQKITESLDFQSIKPTRTIKPVRKLCTGGITSTPAIRERMIKVLEQYKTPVTWETIQHKVSGNRAKVWATLCMFVNEGLVTQTGKGRRGHPYKYVMRAGVTVDSVQGEMENKFKKLDHEAMRLHKQYREKQQEEIQHQQETESIQHLAPYTYVHERTPNSVHPTYDSPFTPL